LDALDSNALTLSGSNVTAWRDKSGENNNSTSVINTPTLRANSINGKSAVFISSNAVRGSFSNTISNRELHCFMVCTALSTNGSYPRFLGLDDGVNGEYNAVTGIEAIGRQGGANFVVSRLNSGAIVNAADDVPHIVSTFNNISNHSIALDGSAGVVTASSGTTGNFAISKWNVGCETSGSLQWNPQVYIGEILVFSNALASNVRYQLEGYLATKWGLTSNLPARHPFRPSLPFMRPFAPVDISGCALWVDAADATCVNVSGSNVTSVLDKSGSNVVLSNSSGFTWPNNTFNGTYPSFFVANGGQDVGGTQRLGVNGELAISTPFTVAFTAQQVGGNYGYVLDSASGASRPFIYGPTINTAGAAGGSNMTNASVVIVAFAPLSGSAVYQNGTTAASGASVSLTTGGITIGNRFNLAESWPGHICEFIIYAGLLTNGQRRQVETYMANKWGLRGATPSNHYARLAPALAGAFVPPQIGACSVWLDAADLTTLTLSGSNVTAWRDKSGTGANATFVGTSVYSSTAQYVQTPGGTGYFTVPCDLRKTTTPQCSLFTVHKRITNPGDNQSVWGTDVGGGWNRIQLLDFPAATEYAYGLTSGGGSPNTYPVNGLNTLNTVIYSAIYDLNVANGSTAHVDGSQNAIFTEEAAATQTSTQLTFFGSGQDSNFYTQIGFNEVIIFRFKLTARERQQVEGYLANKWGLTSKLPAGHPFKRFKP
jgi:hypothetical protein